MLLMQIKKPPQSPTVKPPDRGHPVSSIVLRPVWERRLKELEAFKREHGHCNVPSNYSPNMVLARWVSYIRHRKQSGHLVAPALARRLDGLGFTWVLRRRKVYRRDWDAMVAALTATGETGRLVGAPQAKMGGQVRRPCGIPGQARRLQGAQQLAGQSMAGIVGACPASIPKAE